MNTRITVRFDEETIILIQNISKDRGEQLTDFVRRSVKSELAKLGYLDKNKMKALGVN